jgi:hypothetical protein
MYPEYHLPFWSLYVLGLFLGWFIWIIYKNKFYFKQIQKISSGKKTNEQNLFAAIKELNNEKTLLSQWMTL